MQVEAPAARALEHRGRQDAAVGDHQRDVGAGLAHPGGELGRADLGGLHHREAQLEGARLDGRGPELEAAAGGLVGLADDADHGGDRVQGLERGDGDGRGSEEEGAHARCSSTGVSPRAPRPSRNGSVAARRPPSKQAARRRRAWCIGRPDEDDPPPRRRPGARGPRLRPDHGPVRPDGRLPEARVLRPVRVPRGVRLVRGSERLRQGPVRRCGPQRVRRAERLEPDAGPLPAAAGGRRPLHRVGVQRVPAPTASPDASAVAAEKLATIKAALLRAFPSANVTDSVANDGRAGPLAHAQARAPGAAGPTPREQAPIAKHVVEKDHRLYLGDATHHRIKSIPPASKPMQSEFTMTLPMVRVPLPDTLDAGNAKIETEIGDVDLSPRSPARQHRSRRRQVRQRPVPRVPPRARGSHHAGAARGHALRGHRRLPRLQEQGGPRPLVLPARGRDGDRRRQDDLLLAGHEADPRA